MNISTSHKIAILANPKCGSQSVREMFNPICDIRLRGKKHRTLSTDPHIEMHPHSTAKQVRDAFLRLDWDWNQFTSITTIRNPWDRIVSAWHFAEKQPRSIWRTLKIRSNNDFKKFVSLFPETLSIDHFAGDENGQYIINHIIPIERASFVLPNIIDELELGLSANLPRKNVSRENHSYREYYDRESLEIIKSTFSEDIRIGKYQF